MPVRPLLAIAIVALHKAAAGVRLAVTAVGEHRLPHNLVFLRERHGSDLALPWSGAARA